MPRQRTIKPEFFRDKKIAQLGAYCALLYEALWCWADDGGVVRIDPDLVKGEAFARWPDFTQGLITEYLVRLHGADRLRPYSIGDELYAEIPTLQAHSPANHPSKFRYPRGGQEVTDIRAFLSGQYSCMAPVALREPSASTATTTATTKQQQQPAAALELPEKPIPLPTIPVASSYAMACTVAANNALDVLTAGGYKPMMATVEASTADAWEQLGVPLPVAVATISDAIRRYHVTPACRQPRSLRYFDQAIKEAHEKSRPARVKGIPGYVRPPEPTEAEVLADLDAKAAAQATRKAGNLAGAIATILPPKEHIA